MITRIALGMFVAFAIASLILSSWVGVALTLMFGGFALLHKEPAAVASQKDIRVDKLITDMQTLNDKLSSISLAVGITPKR